MRTYSVWRHKDGSGTTLVEGTRRPRFADGSPVPDFDEMLWRVEAATWEEAMALYHVRMGWAPYKPEGKPAPCPNCAALFYPQGSGECWRCGYVS